MKITLGAAALLLLLPTHQARCGTDDSSTAFIFLPGGHHFMPLRANVQEPRIGLVKNVNKGEMRVDIGNAVDLFGYKTDDFLLTAGVDFWAYGLVTGVEGSRLQIDAIDGFFGGDLSFSCPSGDSTGEIPRQLFATRLRILHQSAHFADGHYSSGSGTWIDNRAPVPYTRDFGELVVAPEFSGAFGGVRPYAGISYATFVRPTSIERVAWLGGIEINLDRLIGPIAGKPTNLYAAYNVGLNGTPVYAPTHHVQAGLKFGTWGGKGIAIYADWYNGWHFSGEYFDERLTMTGAGFSVEF